MQNSISREELQAWRRYIINKPCKYHPANFIKNGTYGLWCGGKDEFGRWCAGEQWPTEEFLAKLRKGEI